MTAPSDEQRAEMVDAPRDLRLAISDPGSLLPRIPGESVPNWSARAILASPWLAARDEANRQRGRNEALHNAVREYLDECNSPAPDYTHRAVLRSRMRSVLAALDGPTEEPYPGFRAEREGNWTPLDDGPSAPSDECGAPAVHGRCRMPFGHNRGMADVPENHSATAPSEREASDG